MVAKQARSPHEEFRKTLQSRPTLKRPDRFYGAARGYDLTFAVSVGTSEDGAFFNAAERLEKAPHIIF